MRGDLVRCPWAEGDPLYEAYHDEEWGVPLRDDRRLFEFLILEGVQAGLSWITVLRRREAYRRAFWDFDAEKMASMDDGNVERLLGESALIRNRRKIESARSNAWAFLSLVEAEGSFSDFLWSFVDGIPVKNRRITIKEIPASTPLSGRLSGELKRRNFSFVGPTICYAFLQAAGLVNDHLVSCFRYDEV
ncbi:DNA-3-methyladenine glycosylase I [Aminithiophilus ramosus]|uniref:DNA-3-methyladenine glycosylase I n=1 Tax=Aminithiophilus ramosus TaxID=3029084 RepID=A0A9Q7ASZ6_9BACT|nr:DNA-3-methyladenine glycosylase I [Aminithiophilus ramosus]QTX33396.1 DNA-3-methyladenine glycosylase I [Aminithiophilus ramosus]